MAANIRTHYNANAKDPAVFAAAVTKSDSADLTNATTWIYVGGGGDVAVTMLGGGNVTFSAVPTGTFMPVRATRILSTGTTATLMLALWRED